MQKEQKTTHFLRSAVLILYTYSKILWALLHGGGSMTRNVPMCLFCLFVCMYFHFSCVFLSFSLGRVCVCFGFLGWGWGLFEKKKAATMAKEEFNHQISRIKARGSTTAVLALTGRLVLIPWKFQSNIYRKITST